MHESNVNATSTQVTLFSALAEPASGSLVCSGSHREKTEIQKNGDSGSNSMNFEATNPGEQSNHAASPDAQVYSIESGLLFRLSKQFPSLSKRFTVKVRTIIIIGITYLPMLFLASLQGVAWSGALKIPLVIDIEEAVRFLVAAPLLIAAEPFIQPWLNQVVTHVRERLVQKESLAAYDKIVRDALKLQDSVIVEILILAGTFCWQFCDFHALKGATDSTWRTLPLSGEPSLALLWYVYFAKPLFRFLWLRWLWRYIVWSFLLLRVSSLKLDLVPTHPDRHGGLEFIATGHTRFALLALSVGTIAAAIVAKEIVFDGKQLYSYEYTILGIVALVLFIFLTPLLVFSGKLLELKRKGSFEYGALADEYTKQFHQRWICNPSDKSTLLGSSDIQSLADLDGSFSIVQQLKLCLIGKEIILTFLVATLLPFAPLLLTIYPFNELLNHLVKTFV